MTYTHQVRYVATPTGQLLRSGYAQLQEAHAEPSNLPVWIASYAGIKSIVPSANIRSDIANSINEIAETQTPKGCADLVGLFHEDSINPVLVLSLPQGKLLSSLIRNPQSNELLASKLRTLTSFVDFAVELCETLERCWRAGTPHLAPTEDRVWVDHLGRPTLLGLGEAQNLDHTLLGASEGSNVRARHVWHLPPEVVAQIHDEHGSNTSEERTAEQQKADEVYVLASTLYSLLAEGHPFLKRAESESSTNLADLSLSNCITRMSEKSYAPLDDYEEWSDTTAVLYAAIEQRPGALVKSVTHFKALLLQARERDLPKLPTGAPGANPLRLSPRWRDALIWKVGVLALFLISAGQFWVQCQTPTSYLILSEPLGAELVERAGHLEQSLGRTPIVLEGRDPNSTLRLHLTDGDTLGPEYIFNPSDSNWTDLGRSRLIRLEIVPSNAENEEL